jgi:hypothetical protein
MRARSGRFLAALLLGVLLVCLHSQGHAETPTRFALAVLRRDGVIFPFATYDGGRWSNRWSAEYATEFPIALADVPKDWWPTGRPVVDWVAWMTDGSSRPIKAQAPVRLDIHCTRRVGLRTNLPPGGPVPPADVQPYPKIGLAVSGPATVEPVETLPPSSPNGDALVTWVAATVTAAETARVKEWAPQWKHPVAEEARAKTPLTIEVLARAHGSGGRSGVYYFEGVKRYPGFVQVEGDPPSATARTCEYLTVATGWLLSDEKGEVVRGIVDASLSNCNRSGVMYALPLGVIRVDGRMFWVVQASSWERESYSVIEIRERSIEVAHRSAAGFCAF